ncbi:hypothetical protein D3C86_2134320 [compost metagenome]
MTPLFLYEAAPEGLSSRTHISEQDLAIAHAACASWRSDFAAAQQALLFQAAVQVKTLVLREAA